MAANTRYPLTATATFSDGTTLDVTGACVWSSATPAVANFASADAGLVSAVAPGTTTVTATLGTLSASGQVTVASATLLGQLSPAAVTLVPNAEANVTAMATLSEGGTQFQQDVTACCLWSTQKNDGVAVAGGARASMFDVNTKKVVDLDPMPGSIQGKIDWFNNRMLPLDLGAGGLTATLPWTNMDPPDSFPLVDRLSTDGDVTSIITGVFGGSLPMVQEFVNLPPYEYWNGESHYAHYNPYDAKSFPGLPPRFGGICAIREARCISRSLELRACSPRPARSISSPTWTRGTRDQRAHPDSRLAATQHQRHARRSQTNGPRRGRK